MYFTWYSPSTLKLFFSFLLVNLGRNQQKFHSWKAWKQLCCGLANKEYINAFISIPPNIKISAAGCWNCLMANKHSYRLGWMWPIWFHLKSITPLPSQFRGAGNGGAKMQQDQLGNGWLQASVLRSGLPDHGERRHREVQLSLHMVLQSAVWYVWSVEGGTLLQLKITSQKI